MIEFLQHLRQRWNDWCGDRDMELSIRKHLSENGFYGGTARLRNVRLVAVQRPGWLQVFRFEATARLQPAGSAAAPNPGFDSQSDDSPDAEAEYRELFGLVRDDIRHKINSVRIFEDESERRALFARWSQDLICLRGSHGLSIGEEFV